MTPIPDDNLGNDLVDDMFEYAISQGSG